MERTDNQISNLRSGLTGVHCCILQAICQRCQSSGGIRAWTTGGSQTTNDHSNCDPATAFNTSRDVDCTGPLSIYQARNISYCSCSAAPYDRQRNAGAVPSSHGEIVISFSCGALGLTVCMLAGRVGQLAEAFCNAISVYMSPLQDVVLNDGTKHSAILSLVRNQALSAMQGLVHAAVLQIMCLQQIA